MNTAFRRWLDEFRCHEFESGPCTTEAYRNTCGRCGGDRRRPRKAVTS